MDFIAWIGETGFSTWLRESPSIFPYPFIIACHSIGMGIIVGTSVAVDLRIADGEDCLARSAIPHDGHGCCIAALVRR